MRAELTSTCSVRHSSRVAVAVDGIALNSEVYGGTLMRVGEMCAAIPQFPGIRNAFDSTKGSDMAYRVIFALLGLFSLLNASCSQSQTTPTKTGGKSKAETVTDEERRTAEAKKKGIAEVLRIARQSNAVVDWIFDLESRDVDMSMFSIDFEEVLIRSDMRPVIAIGEIYDIESADKNTLITLWSSGPGEGSIEWQVNCSNDKSAKLISNLRKWTRDHLDSIHDVPIIVAVVLPRDVHKEQHREVRIDNNIQLEGGEYSSNATTSSEAYHYWSYIIEGDVVEIKILDVPRDFDLFDLRDSLPGSEGRDDR